jgi:hypothetical protein
MKRTTRSKLGRLGTSAVAVLTLCGAAVAVADGSVGAQRRDPCADRAHRAQVALDIALGWWVLGETLTAIGDVAAADDAYAYADYFFAEWEMYTFDAC